MDPEIIELEKADLVAYLIWLSKQLDPQIHTHAINNFRDGAHYVANETKLTFPHEFDNVPITIKMVDEMVDKTYIQYGIDKKSDFRKFLENRPKEEIQSSPGKSPKDK